MLAITALSNQALLKSDLSIHDEKIIQKRIDDLDQYLQHYQKRGILSNDQLEHAKAFQLQIWQDNGRLLLHSNHSPQLHSHSLALCRGASH